MAVHLKALLDSTQILHPNHVEDKTCPVCFENYLRGHSREYPRKLPCGHVVGTECLLIWASSQTHATSIDCPWCRKPIIRSVDAQFIRTIMFSCIEAGFTHFWTLWTRAERAVERALDERRGHLLAIAVAFTMLAGSFNALIAWVPLIVLYTCIESVIERRLESHPRRGAALLVLGFGVGVFYSHFLGSVLIGYGMAPFKGKMFGAFARHLKLVGGVMLGVVALKAAWGYPVVDFVAKEMEWWFLICSLQYVGTM